ncbi:expressed unknown protein [Seminavis robusta]|uniref:Uncharacterized protein n=1 Tax=Seminavis robusta TaxID=568900 RepID=A0A9N8HSG8_9STRA|nr:expressed unknown protein [Seminavis robusta]|eukprot:Sro1442_g273070.1 n/a (150) ;mRNA; r:21404-21853
MCHQQSRSSIPKRRRVTFKSSVHVVHKPCSKKEAKTLWYSKKELKKIRLGIRCSLKNLELAIDDTSKEQFQWRGLELVKRGCSALESQRILIKGVLSLQKMHKQLGLRDEKTINLFATAFNREAVLQAQETAKEDFVEATQIHKEGEQN